MTLCQGSYTVASGDGVAYDEGMEALAHNIRARRNALGMTQQSLADECGVCRVTIARIETCATNTDWSTVCKIADALHTTVDKLRKPAKKIVPCG